MDLILEQGLEHQQKAVDALRDAFERFELHTPQYYYENPRVRFYTDRVAQNVFAVQDRNGIPQHLRRCPFDRDCLNLDVKMETGTGKTYVYTKAIYELNKYYGFNKFIVAVPTLAIKSGTAQFMQDPYVQRHFRDGCGYGTDLQVGVLSATAKKRGRSYFPAVISDFVRGSCQDSKKIYVLLLNMQLLTSGKMLSRDDYDYGAEGFYRPFDALRATRPLLIIDEPHRFDRNNSAYKAIKSEINPQCIIRFGATFPEISAGKGKYRTKQKDYINLLYDLNACQSFNQGLIKGVAKEHFEPLSQREEKVKIVSVRAKDEAHFMYRRRDEAAKSYTLKTGDSMSMIDSAFEGITIAAIGKSQVEFSNGMVKNTGEELDVDIYMTSYQEQMLHLALQRHFETEKANFCNRNANKIKTLALFFIDDIMSYRTDEEGKTPYLREAFERLLKEECNAAIGRLNTAIDIEAEYADYLRATLADVSACHAGYFAQDNSDSDDAVAQEIELILHGKKDLLAFRNKEGNWNTCRFLFSKWTLKEGWDNPNVFTIAKLRSSGSETSKLQEVGRGLRLPVDEYGNRISNEDFYLNYIVDFTEADFATKLVEQINGELPVEIQLNDEKIEHVAYKLGKDAEELFRELYDKHYIDWHKKVVFENRDKFVTEYPDFADGILNTGKVKDRNIAREKRGSVKIRKAVYGELKELWEKINRRYLLLYDDDLDDSKIEAVALQLFEKGVFKDVVLTSHRDVVEQDGERMRVGQASEVQYVISRPLRYGDFLKRIAAATTIPVTVLHSAVCSFVKKHGELSKDKFNQESVAAFCKFFTDWKNDNLQGRFRYSRSNYMARGTALTNSDGTPRDEIAIGRIGTMIREGTPSAKYLYDAFAYGSPLELDNILADIDEVVVYGKIPTTSIAIPVVVGETYSPDFMYVVKRKDGTKELNVVVETKDVKTKSELRGTEETRINCAEVFFKNLSDEGFKVYFKRQLNGSKMRQVLNDVFNEETQAG